MFRVVVPIGCLPRGYRNAYTVGGVSPLELEKSGWSHRLHRTLCQRMRCLALLTLIAFISGVPAAALYEADTFSPLAATSSIFGGPSDHIKRSEIIHQIISERWIKNS
eukprot:1186237-Prorocentrum_minimum.AAC.2